MLQLPTYFGIVPLLGLLGAVAGCTATAGGSRPGTGSDGGGMMAPGPPIANPGSTIAPTGPGMVPMPPANAVVGPTMLRRLTNIEYRNTVQSLLKLPTLPADALQADSLTNGFDNVSISLTVAPSIGLKYADLAANQAKAFTVPACAPPATEAQCASDFIATVGKSAFRRPIAPAEQAAYEALYADQRTRSDHVGGIRQVLQTFLQSPHLLYRFELGDTAQGAQRTLNPYEVATQLAYMFTASPPDSALLAGADANQLSTRAQLEAAARRLLGLPSARLSVRRFVQGFADTLGLGQLNKDAATYPNYTPALRAAMQQESELFIDSILWEGDGSYTSLMTAPFGFVNSELAAFYGLPDAGQQTLVKTTLNALERQGLLTQAAVLAAHSKPDESSPVKRGKFIRVGLLCQDLPSPPAMVPQVQPPQPNLTTRERFAQHSVNPACSGCHALIDPLGFGLENYDGIGQFRALESGKPVDASGNATATLDINGSFTGAIELSNKLSGSQEAKQCLTLKAYGWAFGRAPLDAERAVVNTITEPLATNGLDIREVMVALTQSNNFLFRSFH